MVAYIELVLKADAWEQHQREMHWFMLGKLKQKQPPRLPEILKRG